MSARVCVCVGVKSHDDPRLQVLEGAERDASNMFAALTNPYQGSYEPSNSRLLQDPEKSEVSEALADVLYGHDIDTFTFFFAGHGGVAHDTFALCCSDTNCDRFIASALPITELFQLLNDAKPRQSNIIIDACQAAGMVADLGALLKPSQLGTANSASVSIFVTSASDRTAGETDHGGVGTTFLLGCIEGNVDCRVLKEHLSLDDIGAAVRTEFGEQAPSVWSFNVSGASQFVKNPHSRLPSEETFVPTPNFGTAGIPKIDEKKASELWRLYTDAEHELDVRTLQMQLESTVSGFNASEHQAALLLGLAENFASRASISDDCFAPVEALCAFIFATRTIGDEDVRKKATAFLLAQVDATLTKTLDEISEAMHTEYALLAKGGAYSEFFSLPIRITKVSAWSLVSLHLAGDHQPNTSPRRDAASNIMLKLSEKYIDSFSLMSEEQAPFILVISELGAAYGFSDWCEEYISTLYADFFNIGFKVAKTALPDEDVLDFLRYRCSDDKFDQERFSAKPSELVFVLLYHFLASSRLDIVRYDFREMDHLIVSSFIPDSYADFSDEVVYDGSNIQFHIGFDVFTAQDFSELFAMHLRPAIEHAAEIADSDELNVALLASLIYPNRVPWFLAIPEEKQSET